MVDCLPTFAITEVWESESSAKLVAAWRRDDFPPIKALSIDMFNFKTDYSKSATVADLNRINEAQIAEAPRYRYLADARESRDLVATLLDNALAITHHLKHASRLLIDTPSRLQQGQAELATAHAAFARLGDLDIRYSPELMLIGQGFERIGGTAAFDWKLNEWITERTSTPMRRVRLHYRASELGWAAADFHRACVGLPRLLLIARSTSGFLFGGFTSSGFGIEDNTKRPDAAAFLFTLTNPHGIVPTMLPSKKGDSEAVNKISRYCAIFGGKYSDLCFVSNSNSEPASFSNLGAFSYTDTTKKGRLLFTGTNPLGTMAEILVFSV
jgi:hypothetical protein